MYNYNLEYEFLKYAIMKYEHIIFDIDGTLLDTEFAVLHSLQDTAMLYLNRHIPTDELNFALGIPGEVALANLGIKDIKEANKCWNDKMVKYQQRIRLFDGARNMLDALHNKGCRLGIITSKTRGEYETDFVPHGVSHYFDSVICVDDSEKPKPNPDPLLTYLKRNGVLAKDVIYIGDTQYDSMCAHSAGVDFGLALWGCHNSNNIECEYQFESPDKIVKEYGKQ